MECYMKCTKNSDCKSTGCCSDGYCTGSTVCVGMKLNGDYCDINEECATNFCSNNICAVSSFILPKEALIFGIILITLLISSVVLVLIIHCYNKYQTNHEEMEFNNNEMNKKLL